MLPREARLRKRRDFSAVLSRSQAGRGRSLVQSSIYLSVHVRRTSMYGARGDCKEAPRQPAAVRFGFVVSKKVSKRAHDRNRLKRRLSEAARTKIVLRGIKNCCDCAVVVRRPALDLDFQALAHELIVLLRRVGIVRLTGADDTLSAMAE